VCKFNWRLCSDFRSHRVQYLFISWGVLCCSLRLYLAWPRKFSQQTPSSTVTLRLVTRSGDHPAREAYNDVPPIVVSSNGNFRVYAYLVSATSRSLTAGWVGACSDGTDGRYWCYVEHTDLGDDEKGYKSPKIDTSATNYVDRR
jgi:hypothetical protein